MSVQEKRERLKSLLEKQTSSGDGPARLSPAQMRLWEIEANESSPGMHTFALAYYLQGPLDINALDKALHAVAARHPGLRRRIALEAGRPCFQPAPMAVPILQRYDGSAESQLEERLRAESALPLDPCADRAWRCALFRGSDNAYALLIRFHHIIADRWSVGIFVRDLGQAYSDLMAGNASFPSELPPPDWVDDDARNEEQLAFWKGVFSPPPRSLELPLASDPDGFSGYAGARIEAEIDPATVQALKALAAAESLTLFPVLLAAFAALLRAHTGQEDLVLCTPVTGRHRAGTRQAIGYFNNILPLRLDLQGDPSFRSLAARVAEQARAAYANQDVPFHEIASLSELDSVRTTRCLFAVQNIPGLELRLPGVQSSYRDIPNGTANFDLSLFLEEKDGRLIALLDYKTAVYSAEAAGALKDRFLALLQQAAARPAARLSEFPDYGTEAASDAVPADTEATAGATVVDNMLEQRVIALWRDLFGGDRERRIGPETNFFHIGGDSLKAARLFARLKEEFDLEWPLATLIEAPTPRKLAQRMSDKEWILPWLSLIPLQTAGDRTPLYFLPGGFGNILCFRRIADCLGADQPVYCLQAKGLKRGEKAMRSVEETADYYIKIVRRAQPTGPYLLAGHSFGAVVAYEMARRLIMAGEEVPLMALLDHSGPDIKLTRTDYLRYYLMSLSQLSARERVHYLIEGIAWKLHVKRALYHRKSAAKRKEDPEARWSPMDVAEGALRALRDYTVPPFPGRLTLFRAEKHPKIRLDRWGGWGHVAAQVEIIDVPGTHESMLEEPNVQVLGEKLRLCLDRIAAQETGS